MELRDLQLEELNILKECISIFEKHNLTYYMLGGTFLGAIRHKGFIPWDDDIDIGMPRPDYETFIEIAKKELPAHLFLANFKEEGDYKKYIIKVMNKKIVFKRDDTLVANNDDCLWIDIFPLDGMPRNSIALKVHKFHLLYRRLMLQYANFDKGVNIKRNRPFHEKLLIKFGFVFTKVFHLNPVKQLYKLDSVMTKYPYDSSDFVVNFMGAYKFKEMFPKAYYDNPVKYPFEDIELYGASEYDKILSQMYGDYMKPPADNQRFSHSISEIKVCE